MQAAKFKVIVEQNGFDFNEIWSCILSGIKEQSPAGVMHNGKLIFEKENEVTFLLALYLCIATQGEVSFVVPDKSILSSSVTRVPSIPTHETVATLMQVKVDWPEKKNKSEWNFPKIKQLGKVI